MHRGRIRACTTNPGGQEFGFGAGQRSHPRCAELAISAREAQGKASSRLYEHRDKFQVEIEAERDSPVELLTEWASCGESLMSDEKRVTVRVEELTLTNTLQLTAIVELLEERGIMTQRDVVERMKAVRDRKKPS